MAFSKRSKEIRDKSVKYDMLMSQERLQAQFWFGLVTPLEMDMKYTIQNLEKTIKGYENEREAILARKNAYYDQTVELHHHLNMALAETADVKELLSLVLKRLNRQSEYITPEGNVDTETLARDLVLLDFEEETSDSKRRLRKSKITKTSD